MGQAGLAAAGKGEHCLSFTVLSRDPTFFSSAGALSQLGLCFVHSRLNLRGF